MCNYQQVAMLVFSEMIMLHGRMTLGTGRKELTEECSGLVEHKNVAIVESPGSFRVPVSSASSALASSTHMHRKVMVTHTRRHVLISGG